MKVNELTAKIHDEFPKVWGKLTGHIVCNYDIVCISVDGDNNEYIVFRDVWADVPFSMLYGLLEDFFMDHGIIINVDWHLEYGTKIIMWAYDIGNINVKNGCLIDHKTITSELHKTKIEAKQQAILKACEILEGRL